MKKLYSIILVLVLVSTSSLVFADQVWGDAVEVLGSNHDQFIDITISQGETWSTPLKVYIVDSGAAVSFPVNGIINADSSLTLSKLSWQVNGYESPDTVQISKEELLPGSYSYSVTFEATTDLSALSKSFDKVNIRVQVNESNDFNNLDNENQLDLVAPIIIAPDDLQVEATALLTPVYLGEAIVDDPDAIVTNDSPEYFPLGSTQVNWKATDLSGNEGYDQQLITIVDTTAPVFTSFPQNLSVIYQGQLTEVDLGLVEATDIFPVEISNDAPESGFPLGKSYVEWKATDSNGNVSVYTQVIEVSYQFGGFLEPINTDGSSIFKLGSTVPVKFRLFDANGNYVPTAIAKIYVSKLTDSILGSVVEATSTGNASTGNLFRYDSTDNQYIFNLSTKSLSKGSYLIIVRLDDGKEYSVRISLR